MLNLIYIHLLKFVIEIISKKKIEECSVQYEIQAWISIVCHFHFQLLLHCTLPLLIKYVSLSFEWYTHRFSQTHWKSVIECQCILYIYKVIEITLKNRSFSIELQPLNRFTNQLSQLYTQLTFLMKHHRAFPRGTNNMWGSNQLPTLRQPVAPEILQVLKTCM